MYVQNYGGKMSEKLLTIAIPTYNGEKTISNMLDILLPQCLKYIDKIEVFISDNASTDDTALKIRVHGSTRYFRFPAGTAL